MKRNCLKCNKEFESIHKGNRICSRCNLRNTCTSRMDSELRQGKRDDGIKRLGNT